MEKLKVLSLFSGIGAFEEALKLENINYDLVGFCENDNYAIKSYAYIHDIPKELNLGNIMQLDMNNISSEIDLLTHGSPCQDFSIGGKQLGGDEGSQTRSSLMWNTVEIIKYCKPKYIIWENVSNVLSEKHKHNFDKYINELDNLGYQSSYDILNPIDFNIPHDRNRVFVVSVKKDLSVKFTFPHKQTLNRFLLDYVDESNKKMNVSNIVSEHIDTHYKNKIRLKKDYPITIITEIRPSRCSIKTNGISPCLVAKMGTGGNNVPIIAEWKRPFTIAECMKLMGFSDESILKIQETGNPKSQIYKQIGNSVSVDILRYIFKILLNKYIIQNNNIEQNIN